jgi:hypothetical protein
LSKTAETSSGVLGSLSSGMNRITERLNAISPDIVSRIDPDFVAAAELRNTVSNSLDSSVQPISNALDSLTGKAISPERSLLGQDGLNGLADPLALAGSPQDQRGHARPLPKVTCISGCTPQASQPIRSSGFAGILGRGNSIGGNSQTPSGSSVLNSLGGTLGNGGGSSPSGGGVLSSTVNTTSSILGGTTKKILGR